MTRNRKTFLVFFVMFASLFVTGEQPPSRYFDSQEMASYLEMDDFSYMSLTVRPPSIWERLQWWYAGLISRFLANPNSSFFTNFLFYGLLFLVLGVAIFYMLRLKYAKAISSETKHSGTVGVASINANTAQDFDKMIEEARSNKEFKLAIRYLYLKSLYHLAANDLVKLKNWKSPHDYKRELAGDLVPIYIQLSDLFEFVWYGDFDAGEKELNEGSALLMELEGKAR